MGGDGASTAESYAQLTLDNMPELRTLVEEVNLAGSGERVHVAVLVDTELLRVPLVSSTVWLESNCTASKEICDVQDGFLVEVSYDAPGLSASAGGRLIRFRPCPCCDHLLCLDLVNYVDYSSQFLFLARHFFRLIAFLQCDELDFSSLVCRVGGFISF